MAKITPKQWADIVRATVKDAIADSEMTYADLAKLLRKQGLEETEYSITAKLKRGTFSAIFLFAVFNALGIHELRILGHGEHPPY